MKRPYLFRTHDGQILQAARLRVGWREILKRKPSRTGLFVELEHAGHDRSGLKIFPTRDEPNMIRVVFENGIGASSYSASLDRSSSAISKVARRIRKDDAAIVEGIDDQIAERERAILELRRARASAVKAAWRRAERLSASEAEPQDGETSRYLETPT